jgi:hypothetical protein
MIYWTVTENSTTKSYTGLPALKVTVGGATAAITVPATV